MKKIFLFLFLFLITLGAALALWKQSRDGGGELGITSYGKLPERLFHFRVEEVRKIVVSWQKESVTLFLDEQDSWRLKERGGALASASRINGILASLSTLAPLKRILDSSPEMLRELSLRVSPGKDPGDKIPPGILVRLFGKGEKEMEKIVLGSGHFPPVSGNRRENVLPSARYIKCADGKIYLVSKVFEELLPIPMAYVEPFAVRGMERALMISSYELPKKGTGEKLLWCVGRKGTSQAFRTIYPRGKIVPQQALASLAKLLSKQMTLDLVMEKLPPKGERKMIIHLADGFSYQLEFFPKGIHLYMKTLLSFREKGVQLHPGESREGYLRRVESLKLRYSYEKKYFHNKCFLVRPDSAGDLLKDPFAGSRKSVRRKAVKRK